MKKAYFIIAVALMAGCLGSDNADSSRDDATDAMPSGNVVAERQETTTTIPVLDCVDSDGGMDEYTAGSVRVETTVRGKPRTLGHADECIKDGVYARECVGEGCVLHEYICGSEPIVFEEIDCAKACVDGACVN